MFCYKLNNFLNGFGQPNYKGLDKDKNIAGSQIYPYDFNINNFCSLVNMEDIKSNGDLVQITEEEYLKIKEEIQSSYPKPQPNEKDLQIQSLQQTVLILMTKVATLEKQVGGVK